MARGLLGFDVQDSTREKRGGGAFLWTVVLLLLTGAALASWIGSFYVIGHPELPSCYRFLKKLKKLESPWQFGVISDPVKKEDPARKGRRTEPPRGTFLSPKQLLERVPKAESESLLGFGTMSKKKMAENNAELLRMYLKNYRENKKSVPYVTGVFEVVEAHLLKAGDFFPSGVVALTQAKDYPQVLVEMVFPANSASTRTILSLLPRGREITLERSRDLAAVIHCERMSDSQMQFTVVPLLYGAFQLKDARGSFTLKSPEDLEDPKYGGNPNNAINIDGTFPIIQGMRFQQDLADYATYRRKILASGEAERPAPSQIIALRSTSPGGAPVEVATPKVIREAAPPLPTPAPAPTPIPTRTPRNPTSPVATPTPRPAIINSVAPTPVPQRFPLAPRPIVRAAPQPVAPPTPEPEPPKPVVLSMPPVKRQALTTKEASALVDSFDPSAEMVISGEFVVTGVLGQRVALRASEALRDRDADPTVAGTTGAMIVVDFPQGTQPPAKDTTFSRDGARGFRIKSIRRSGTGQITIMAEDAAKP